MAYEKLTYIYLLAQKVRICLNQWPEKVSVVSRFKWNIDCKCNQI